MNSILRKGLCGLGLAALALALAGCGPSMPATVKVSGTVTLDGVPLEGAGVNFVSNEGGRQATGQTDAAGKFTLTTFKAGDGAPAGKYKVGVSKLDVSADQKGDPSVGKSPSGQGPPAGTMLSGPPMAKGAVPKAPKSLVPVKYTNPTTSGIEYEVKPGMEPPKIELKSK